MVGILVHVCISQVNRVSVKTEKDNYIKAYLNIRISE